MHRVAGFYVATGSELGSPDCEQALYQPSHLPEAPVDSFMKLAHFSERQVLGRSILKSVDEPGASLCRLQRLANLTEVYQSSQQFTISY